MSPVTILATFVVIFPAELPDKTAIASLMLGTRYRASLVFAGVAAAFACHVTLAVLAGSLLHKIPHKPLEIIITVLFALGAVLLLRGEDEEEAGADELEIPEMSNWKVVATSFGIILVAEFGDITQIVTANLAAKSHDPLAVAIGSMLALWAVGGLAILGGQKLLTKVPLKTVTRVAAAIMLGLAIWTLAGIL